MTNDERRRLIWLVEDCLAEIAKHDGRAERKIKKVLKEMLEVLK